METQAGEAEGEEVEREGGRAPTQVIRSAIARIVRILCAHARSLLIVGSRAFCVNTPVRRIVDLLRSPIRPTRGRV